MRNDKKNEINSNIGIQKKNDKNTAQKVSKTKLSLGAMNNTQKKLTEAYGKHVNQKKIKINLYSNPEETKNNFSYYKAKSGRIDEIKLNKSFQTNSKMPTIKANNNLSFTANKKTNNKADDYINEFRTGSYVEENKGFQKSNYKSMKTSIDEIKTVRRDIRDRKYSFQIKSQKREFLMRDSNFKRNSSRDKEKKDLTLNLDSTNKIKRFESSKISHRPSNKKIIEEEDDDWNIEQFKGYRKTTIDVTKRSIFKNKLTSEFSKLDFVKASKAITVAGRGENGLKKINQDTYICERSVNGILNFNILGVLDGHGVNGHYVSQFVSKYIVNKIKNHPLIKNLDNPKKIYQQLKINGYQIIASTFIDADVQVTKEKFDCLRSGTTCVIVFQLEEHIICANAGDSRAIMILDDSNNAQLKNTKIYPLSIDCKPENPMERLRINKNGGSVEQIIDENNNGIGPFRVYVKGKDNPGLSMSRSIGDIEAKTVGVIPNPQIIEYELSPKSKYMLICSDGIWEFISNEEAMEIGNKFYLLNDPLGLCHKLKNESTKIWINEDIFIDDITVVVVFF
jgi:serine/threonine protein phosphatase PrpC